MNLNELYEKVENRAKEYFTNRFIEQKQYDSSDYFDYIEIMKNIKKELEKLEDYEMHMFVLEEFEHYGEKYEEIVDKLNTKGELVFTTLMQVMELMEEKGE